MVVAPRMNWKGCRLSWTALPYAKLKESEWFHPQGVPSLSRVVAKISGENVSPVRLPKQELTQELICLRRRQECRPVDHLYRSPLKDPRFFFLKNQQNFPVFFFKKEILADFFHGNKLWSA